MSEKLGGATELLERDTNGELPVSEQAQRELAVQAFTAIEQSNQPGTTEAGGLLARGIAQGEVAVENPRRFNSSF